MISGISSIGDPKNIQNTPLTLSRDACHHEHEELRLGGDGGSVDECRVGVPCSYYGGRNRGNPKCIPGAVVVAQKRTVDIDHKCCVLHRSKTNST